MKNSLSAYLKKVRTGQSALILDRDQPVARLERIESTEGDDDAIARLEGAGLVRRGRALVPLLRQESPKRGRSVAEALMEERREVR